MELGEQHTFTEELKVRLAECTAENGRLDMDKFNLLKMD